MPYINLFSRERFSVDNKISKTFEKGKKISKITNKKTNKIDKTSKRVIQRT